LSHDLYTVVQKQTSISLSELLEQIHGSANKLREAAAMHKGQFVDGGVPVAPCLANLVMPILRENLPEKMTPRARERKSGEHNSATELPEGSAKEDDAVGRATAQEEGRDKEDAESQLSQSSNKTPRSRRRRWQLGALQATANSANLKASAPKAKAAGSFARRVRLHVKTKELQSNSRRRATKSAKQRKKPPTAKSPARKRRKSNASSSKLPATE
jgi:hypothetical protein